MPDVLITGDNEVVLIEQDVFGVVIQDTATQGPPGPPGFRVQEFPAGSNISGHKVVGLDQDGTLFTPSTLQRSHMGSVVGITVNATSQGQLATVKSDGSISHAGWSWTPNEPVFLGDEGTLTQVTPPGATWLQVVGWARSATLMVVSLQPPISS